MISHANELGRVGLSAEEQKKFDGCMAKADNLAGQLEKRGDKMLKYEDGADVAEMQEELKKPLESDRKLRRDMLQDSGGLSHAPNVFHDLRTGQEVRQLEPGQSIMEGRDLGLVNNESAEEQSIGRLIQALWVPEARRYLTETEERTLLFGKDSGGGVLVDNVLSSKIIDPARDATVVASLAQQFTMEQLNLSLVGISTDAVAQFVAEGAAGTESDMEFKAVNLEAKAITTWVTLSDKLMRASNAAQQIEDSLKYAVARGLDLAILRGSAGADLDGLENTTGRELNVGYTRIAARLLLVVRTNLPGIATVLAYHYRLRESVNHRHCVDGFCSASRPGSRLSLGNLAASAKIGSRDS